MDAIGRSLIIIAVVLFIVGLLFIGMARLGLGRLPGDIVYRHDGVTIYFPIATAMLISIILSLLLSLIGWLISRGR